MSSLKLALVAAIMLVLVGPADAGGRGGKVDWSDFIDPNATPSAPVGSANGSATPAPDETPAPRAKQAKASRAKKKVAKKAKSRKARAKKSRR